MFPRMGPSTPPHPLPLNKIVHVVNDCLLSLNAGRLRYILVVVPQDDQIFVKKQVTSTCGYSAAPRKSSQREILRQADLCMNPTELVDSTRNSLQCKHKNNSLMENTGV